MPILLKWNKSAFKQFDDAVAYIEKDSTVNGEKFRTDILFKIDLLLKHPERYAPDKYKSKNDGSFRAFELHHYRISYRYIKDEVRILRIRHTKMNPKNY